MFFYEKIKDGLFNSRRPLIVLLAAAAWLVLPFAFGSDSSVPQAQTATSNHSLVAHLTGPANVSVAFGVAVYDSTSAAGTTARALSVDIYNVVIQTASAPAPAAFLNSTNIGNITLDPSSHGHLFLTTANGGSVPNVVAGDTLTVKSGGVVLLSGVFAPPATPSPTPTRTPLPTPVSQLYAPLLSPAAASGLVSRGLAEYTAYSSTSRRLEVYLSNINQPEGTVLKVFVAGNAVGTIVLHMHNGLLRLNTDGGDTVPQIAAGTPISVRNGSAVVLAGVFTSPPPPPTPTPTVSPTPVKTPGPARAFAAKLNGGHEVPPVMTDGRGFGFVMINAAEDAINVRVAFVHLSSAVTSVTINGPAAADANGPVIFTLTPNSATAGVAGHFTVDPQQVAQLRNGLWYFQISTANNGAGEIRGQIKPVNRRNDFDGDGLSDIGVIRSSQGFAPDNSANYWYTLNSADQTFSALSIGQPGDVNVQGDYDGDGIADVAMYTPLTGVWQVRKSGTGETTFTQFGSYGDIPVVGDYDGDTINDLAVFRPSEGNWYVLRSSDGNFTGVHWGTAGDRPVTGDFDGDGVNDLAVFRPSEGAWYINRSSDGGFTAMRWGFGSDIPVSGDFDGDGVNDISVFRPSEGNWYIYRSSDNGFAAFHFGMIGDIPVPCEFDGDGITDIAVYRPSDGTWYINRSSDGGFDAYQFGISTDRPVQTAYSPQ